MKRQLLIIAVLILIAGAINPFVAVMCIRSRTQLPRVPRSVHLTGSEAAAKGWPARGPHLQDWPAPVSLSFHESFGYVRIDGRGVDFQGKSTHSMEVKRMGWPLPVLEVRQFWWPWKDPAWVSPADPNPAMNLYWVGVVANPVIAASAIWVALFGLIVGGRCLARRLGLKQMQRQRGGYPTDESDKPTMLQSIGGSARRFDDGCNGASEKSAVPKKRSGVKLQLKIIVAMVLVAAVINPLVAVMCMKSQRDVSKATLFFPLTGEEAAEEGWPVRGPHELDWPAPTSISVKRSFGFANIRAWSVDSADSNRSLLAVVDWYGWPNPVLERRRFQWPRNDPKWTTTAEKDPAINIHWKGAIANPIIAGVGLWLLVFGPVLSWRFVRQIRRRRHGQCMSCGYPLGVAEVCTECGVDLRAQILDAAG